MTHDFPHVLSVIGGGVRPEAFLPLLSRHGEPALLAPQAFEISFTGDAKSVLAAGRAVAPWADVNVVPASNRKKKLLIADMDSTIISCEVLDELADFAGLKPRVAAITERAMRGEIEFAPALRERVAMLKGLPLAALERTHAERVKINPGAEILVATMRARGAKTMLVSSGFTYFTQRVGEAAGFHEHQANILLDDGAALTGLVREPILGREAKLQTLERAVAELGIAFDDVLAVGDGANDLAMIGRSGLGVAYHAKPVVADAARASIAHADLTALLFLQGYREDEFVTPARA